MTNRTLPAVVAVLAVGVGAALGVVVAERMRARLGAKSAPAPVPEQEPMVQERPTVDAVPPESIRDILATDEMDWGTATLRLRLRDDRDGRPAEMPVRLWRLGVPADATWNAGDEMRASLIVRERGVTVERLPAGRYRVQCLEARDGSDPPEFDVRNGSNERELAVPSRRAFRVRLRLVDERGEVVRRSIQWETLEPAFGVVSVESAPSWATPRKRTLGDRERFFDLGIHCEHVRITPMLAPDRDGYLDLGQLREPDRRAYSEQRMPIRFDSRARIDLTVSERFGTDSTLLGVAPSIDALLAHVTFPDGGSVDPADARVDAVSDAERHDWDAPADAWRSVPVHVTVTVDKHLPLKFVWTGATADLEHRLVPLPPRVPR